MSIRETRKPSHTSAGAGDWACAGATARAKAVPRRSHLNSELGISGCPRQELRQLAGGVIRACGRHLMFRCGAGVVKPIQRMRGLVVPMPRTILFVMRARQRRLPLLGVLCALLLVP